MIRNLLAAAHSFSLMLINPKKQKYHAQTFIHLLEGDSFNWSYEEFLKSNDGQFLLSELPNTEEIFRQKNYKKNNIPGSLGNYYAKFMSEHSLDENYYLDLAISAGKKFQGDKEKLWFRTRVECSHDMRHVLSGYRPDTLGEVCLLSFRFGQIRPMGVFFLVLLGIVQARLTSRGPVLKPVVEAYRRGRDAKLLDLLAWEEKFSEPLADQRSALGVVPSKFYPRPFAPEAYALGARH